MSCPAPHFLPTIQMDSLELSCVEFAVLQKIGELRLAAGRPVDPVKHALAMHAYLFAKKKDKPESYLKLLAVLAGVE